MNSMDWSLVLNDRFYRKNLLYSLGWAISDLSDYLVAVAHDCGLISTIRDYDKLITLSTEPAIPILSISNSSGKIKSQWEWKGPRIISMGFLMTEELVCVLEDGYVRVYTLSGDCTQFTLGEEATTHGLLSAVVIPEGEIIALTSTLSFISVSNFSDPRPKTFSSPQIVSAPVSYTVIPPSQSSSGTLELLIPFNQSLSLLSLSEHKEFHLADGPFCKTSISADGRFVGLVSVSGKVIVCDSSFNTRFMETQLDKAQNPVLLLQSLVWSGSDCLCLLFNPKPDDTNYTLLLLGPFNSSLRFTIPEAPVVIPETDGLRILTANTHEFLFRVPDATTAVFQPGSTGPAAILWDAYKDFENRSAACEEKIRYLKSDKFGSDGLDGAVLSVLEAAVYERDPSLQKSLLRTVSFGRSFLKTNLDSTLPDQVQSTVRTIRLLNSLRTQEIALDLTYPQLAHLSIHTLLSRLLLRQHHFLAWRICEMFELHREKRHIALDWACERIKKRGEDVDGEVYRRLKSLFRDDSVAGVRGEIVSVANVAFERGLEGLAIKLLDLDPHITSQIPFLLSMNYDTLSLSKSLSTLDADMIHTVLSHLRRKHAAPDFFKMMTGQDLVIPLFLKECRVRDKRLLWDFYYQEDRRVDRAMEELKSWVLDGEKEKEKEKESASSRGTSRVGSRPSSSAGSVHEDVEIDGRVSKLGEVVKLMKEEKSLSTEAKLCDEQVKLLQHQTQLSQKLKTNFIGLTVSETLYQLIKLGHIKKADKIRSELKVPDKRYWYIKIRALVSIRDWDSLEKLSRSRSPIGMIPFVEECISAKAFEQAKVFIAKCELERQPELYAKIGK